MNTLIAYFSYTGHTKGIAQQIQDLTGGTLFEIRPLDAYSSDLILPNARPAKKPVKITARHWRSRFPILLPMTPSCWELPTGSIRLPHRSLHSFRRMISLVKRSHCSAPTEEAVWAIPSPTFKNLSKGQKCLTA